MQSIELVIVKALLRDMRAQGYLPAAVYDGGDYVMAEATGNVRSFEGDTPSRIVRPLTDDEVIEAVRSVYESTIHFTQRHSVEGRWGNRGVLIVLGNGEDCISDHHMAPGEPFGDIIDAITDRVSEGAVP